MARFVGYPFVAGDSDDVQSSEVVALGTTVKDEDGNEYIFLKGVGSTVAGSWVTYDEAFATTLVDTDVAASLVGPVAVAQAAVDSTSKYGFYMVKGKTTGLAISGGGAADNAKVYPTSTAGTVDDVASVGNQITRALFRSGESSGSATFQIDYPFIGVADTDT